jgi:excisionase family DNA binding protein
MSIQDNEITTTEASSLFGYTKSHIGLLIRRGLVSGRRIGRDWLVDRESLESYIGKHGRKKRERENENPEG